MLSVAKIPTINLQVTGQFFVSTYPLKNAGVFGVSGIFLVGRKGDQRQFFPGNTGEFSGFDRGSDSTKKKADFPRVFVLAPGLHIDV